MNQINIVIGLSMAYFLNYLILQASTSGADWVATFGIDQYTWRWMLAAEILPAFLWLGLLFLIPESPRWLLLRGRKEEAEDILSRIQTEEQIATQMDSVAESIKENKHSISTFEQITAIILIPECERLLL